MNLGINFNDNLFLQYYCIRKVILPDLSDVEFDRRVFNMLEFFITKYACMSLDYGFEFTCMKLLDDDSDEFGYYGGP